MGGGVIIYGGQGIIKKAGDTNNNMEKHGWNPMSDLFLSKEIQFRRACESFK